MIGTIEIKQAQLTTGYYLTGSGNELILIVGSCRSVPYLNYLNDWNKQNGNRFSIAFIDPFNFNWDLNDQRVDYETELLKQETNDNLLTLLGSTTIFIHEYYANAGMFNCNREWVIDGCCEVEKKNIYQYMISPCIDICIPNFNDIFILTSDIVSFNIDIKKAAIADYNVIGRLSERTLIDIAKVRESNIEKFCDVCSKTDFPEFAEIFITRYKEVRLFWTFNHISKHFTQTIFHLMNEKFLKLNIDNYKISQEDMYANNYTHLTEYDQGYNYGEDFIKLKSLL